MACLANRETELPQKLAKHEAKATE